MIKVYLVSYGNMKQELGTERCIYLSVYVFKHSIHSFKFSYVKGNWVGMFLVVNLETKKYKERCRQ